MEVFLYVQLPCKLDYLCISVKDAEMFYFHVELQILVFWFYVPTSCHVYVNMLPEKKQLLILFFYFKDFAEISTNEILLM